MGRLDFSAPPPPPSSSGASAASSAAASAATKRMKTKRTNLAVVTHIHRVQPPPQKQQSAAAAGMPPTPSSTISTNDVNNFGPVYCIAMIFLLTNSVAYHHHHSVTNGRKELLQTPLHRNFFSDRIGPVSSAFGISLALAVLPTLTARRGSSVLLRCRLSALLIFAWSIVVLLLLDIGPGAGADTGGMLAERRSGWSAGMVPMAAYLVLVPHTLGLCSVAPGGVPNSVTGTAAAAIGLLLMLLERPLQAAAAAEEDDVRCDDWFRFGIFLFWLGIFVLNQGALVVCHHPNTNCASTVVDRRRWLLALLCSPGLVAIVLSADSATTWVVPGFPLVLISPPSPRIFDMPMNSKLHDATRRNNDHRESSSFVREGDQVKFTSNVPFPALVVLDQLTVTDDREPMVEIQEYPQPPDGARKKPAAGLSSERMIAFTDVNPTFYPQPQKRPFHVPRPAFVRKENDVKMVPRIQIAEYPQPPDPSNEMPDDDTKRTVNQTTTTEPVGITELGAYQQQSSTAITDAVGRVSDDGPATQEQDYPQPPKSVPELLTANQSRALVSDEFGAADHSIIHVGGISNSLQFSFLQETQPAISVNGTVLSATQVDGGRVPLGFCKEGTPNNDSERVEGGICIFLQPPSSVISKVGVETSVDSQLHQPLTWTAILRLKITTDLLEGHWT
jgi:hypothetical protein